MTTALILMAIALKLRFAVPAEGPFRTPLPAARSAANKESKPHGRIAWNLYLGNGCKVDLSVMPRGPSEYYDLKFYDEEAHMREVEERLHRQEEAHETYRPLRTPPEPI
ncbi:MAG: hypothetical protein NVV63_12630 [Opitutus sp.]|nr:hypothetical protein [Opitutus sp.]